MSVKTSRYKWRLVPPSHFLPCQPHCLTFWYNGHNKPVEMPLQWATIAKAWEPLHPKVDHGMFRLFFHFCVKWGLHPRPENGILPFKETEPNLVHWILKSFLVRQNVNWTHPYYGGASACWSLSDSHGNDKPIPLNWQQQKHVLCSNRPDTSAVEKLHDPNLSFYERGFIPFSAGGWSWHHFAATLNAIIVPKS